MTSNDIKKTFLPQCDGRALDFIKICAAAFMVIDHINAIWFHYKFFSMLLIGRGTFPLFSYAVAVAVLKAPAALPRQYITRMFILAVAAQPFYMYALGKTDGNVIFTLAFGSLLAALSLRLKPWQMYILYIAALASVFLPPPFDFGLTGAMLPSALLLALRGEKSVYPFLLALIFFMNTGNVTEFLRLDARVWVVAGIGGLASALLPLAILDIAKSLPQKGRLLPKYALHVFYPAHLFLLKILS
jgi:hypothetical protein